MYDFPELLRGGGVTPIYYNITWGGSSETPKLYYVIYEQPLTTNQWDKPNQVFMYFPNLISQQVCTH